MERESRRNLIFLVILLVLLAPGAVILFTKKLKTGEGILQKPESGLYQAAFVDPLPQASNIVRVAPKKTRLWTAEVTSDRKPADLFTIAQPDGSRIPLVTENRSVQVAQVQVEGRRLKMVLLLWDPSITNVTARNFQCVLTIKKYPKTFLQEKVISLEPVEVPLEIYHDLQDVGYVLPPRLIHRAVVQWDLPDSPGSTMPSTFPAASRPASPDETSPAETLPAATLPAADAMPSAWTGELELTLSAPRDVVDTVTFSVGP